MNNHLAVCMIPLAAITLMSGAGVSSSAEPNAEHPGKILAFERDKGNCLACHQIQDAPLPGNVGPPLIHMKQKYPDPSRLRAQIWDATQNNPTTLMPPFGRHRILTESEIDLIVDYLYTL